MSLEKLMADQRSRITGQSGQSEPAPTYVQSYNRADEIIQCAWHLSIDQRTQTVYGLTPDKLRNLLAQAYVQGRLDVETGR